MNGFFNKKEIESSVINKASSCFRCGLAKKHCQNPKMEPEGLFQKKIMIITNGVRYDDDHKGYWATFENLRKTFESFNIEVFDDCVVIGSTNCMTPQNRPVKNTEIDNCRDVKVLKAIKYYKPKLIILFGMNAVKSLIGHRWKKKIRTIDTWRGWNIPDKDFKAWICPMYDPFEIEHWSEVAKVIFKDDLKRALRHLGKKFPKFPDISINYIDDLKVLRKIKWGKYSSFDYETPALKPHKKEHKIACASIAVNSSTVYAFLFPKDKKQLSYFIEYLGNETKKIAANFKFENNWSWFKLKTIVKNWVHDTMLYGHFLDNRPYTKSLKFQVYVKLGIVNYDEEIEPYLEAIDPETEGGNSINRVHELLKTREGTQKLLKYCALDSVYTYQIFLLQLKEYEKRSI